MATIEDIKKEYTKEKQEVEKNRWWIRYVLRPLSWRQIWFFAKIGATPNQVTYLGFLFAMVGVFGIATGNYLFGIVGALLLNERAVLECVDGGLARILKKYSKRGVFLDETTGYIVHGFLMVAIGFSAFLSTQQAIYILFGGISAVLCTLYYLVKYSYYNISKKFASDVVKGENFIFSLGFNIWDITSGLMPILLIATVMNRMDLLAYYCVAINIVVFAFIYVSLIRKSGK